MIYMAQNSRKSRPEWLKVKLPGGEEFFRLKALVREHRLNTVCEGALCPNIAECWKAGTATFMILGDVCTRACKFCAVKTGLPPKLDHGEPRRVAAAIRKLDLKYAIVTSVDRDDLKDGGASIYAETIRLAREACPGIQIEVLIPDFRGKAGALQVIVEERPDVLGHNVETVPRLFRVARAGSDYQISLDLLRNAKSYGIPIATKSSLMLGLGEHENEILQVIQDLKEADVDIVTFGQYLQPTRENLHVKRYYSPEEFAEYERYAYSMGFRYVASGPLVRSSYHAEKQASLLPVSEV
jgi:lipoic acid synthetase